jgi:hypothetical protein
MLKDFFIPDWRRVMIYLIFVLIFMSEIFIIRYLYHVDNIVLFISDIYQNFPGLESYIDVFTLAFFFYIFIFVMIQAKSLI